MTTTFAPDERVTYRSHQNATAEHGAVVSIGEHFIFVLFDGDTRTKACAPESLEVER